MASDFVRSLAIQQRKRLVAGLMEHFEKRIAPALPANVRSQAVREYREKVLQSVGQYHDFVLDCLKASISDGSLVNDEAMRLLAQVHESQRRLLLHTGLIEPRPAEATDG